MNILIFEDELFNFRLLQHMLQELNDDYNVIGPISTVEEGRLYLSTHNDTDLIIADIQLNDGLSFDALRQAPDSVPIIFTTAYEEHALKAFEFNSLSYLLKPIDEQQLAEAIHRAARLEHYERVSSDTSNGGNVQSLSNEDSVHSQLFGALSEDSGHRHSFLLKTYKGERRVPIAMVRYAVSDHKTTYLHLLDDTSYPIELSLTELAAQLDPRLFRLVNRKFILPREQVKGTERLSNGKVRLLLYGSDMPDIVVSRERRKEIMEWLG